MAPAMPRVSGVWSEEGQPQENGRTGFFLYIVPCAAAPLAEVGAMTPWTALLTSPFSSPTVRMRSSRPVSGERVRRKLKRIGDRHIARAKAAARRRG